MKLIKSQFMSDIIKEDCQAMESIFNLENVFVLDDGAEFKDGSGKDYRDHLAKIGGAQNHLNEIKAFLNQHIQDNGPAKAEAEYLLASISSFVSAGNDVHDLTRTEKSTKLVNGPNGKTEVQDYDDYDHKMVRELGLKMDHLSGTAPGCKTFNEALRSFNQKTKFELTKRHEMTGLTCLAEAIDTAVMSYQDMSIDNLPEEDRKRKRHAELVDLNIKKANDEYKKLEEFVEEKGFGPLDIPQRKIDLANAIKANEENLTKASLAHTRAKDALYYRDKDIKSLSTKLDVYKKDYEEQIKKLETMEKELDKISKQASVEYTAVEEIEDINTGETIMVQAEAADPEFMQKISVMSLGKLYEVRQQIQNELDANTDILDTKQIDECNSKTEYFANALASFGTEQLSYEKIESLVNPDKLKALPDKDPLKQMYGQIKEAYDKFYPSKDNRGFFGRLGSKFVPNYDAKIKEMVDSAKAAETEASKLPGYEKNQIFNAVLKAEFTKTFADLAEKYTSYKEELPGFKKEKTLRPQFDALASRIRLLSSKTQEEAKTLGVDKEKLDPVSKKLTSLTAETNSQREKCKALKESIDNFTKNLSGLKNQRGELENNLASAEEAYNEAFERKEKLNKDVKTCNTMESMTKKCKENTDKAVGYVNEYKKVYPPIEDERIAIVKSKLEEFHARLEDNQGSHSNSTAFTELANKLTAAKDYLSTEKPTLQEFNQKLAELGQATSEYLAAKAGQKMVLGTTLRKTRLGFAREVKSWCAKTSEHVNKQFRPLETNQAEKNILNYDTSKIPDPEIIVPSKEAQHRAQVRSSYII